jgi:LysM repeat protein
MNFKYLIPFGKMKYSSLSLFASSSIFMASFCPTSSSAQSSEASLLQRVETQAQRIAQLEAELTQLRQQVGVAQPVTTPQAPPKSLATKPASSGGSSYVVQQGETLSSIARKHKVSVTALTDANQLGAPDQIKLGQSLTIPGSGSETSSSAVATPAAAAPGKTAPYTVQKGDTLSSIARAHGSSISAIITENNLANPNSLALGQRLLVPGATKSVSAPAQNVASKSGKSSYGQREFPSGYAYYTVIPGDNLYSIARVFGTSQQELERLNGLSAGSSIRPNQQILVPMDNYAGPYRTS